MAKHFSFFRVTITRYAATVTMATGQVAVNDESGCDKSMESHSGGGLLELALVARLLSMLSKNNSSSSSSSSSSPPRDTWLSSSITACWSRSLAATVAIESGGSWTSSTAGRTDFLLSIKQRLCRTRLRRRNSFLVGCMRQREKTKFVKIAFQKAVLKHTKTL